jgi:putative ABC transport system substrate-binding protein
MPVIGWLNVGAQPSRQNAYIASFLAGVAETGYVEGRNFVLEFWLAEDNGRLPAVATNLVRRRVAMIFAASPPAAVAAKSATAAIPIVFETGSDPVEEALVASLNRPGGNITGVTTLTQELIGKHIELLYEIVSAATTIGYLLDPTGAITEAQRKDAEAASRVLGVQLAILNVSTPSQIETVFTTLVERRIGALTIGTGSGFFFTQREQIASLAARHGTPVIYPWREFVDASGLWTKHFERAQKNSPCNRGLSADAWADWPNNGGRRQRRNAGPPPRGIATGDARLSSQPNKSIAVPYITEISNSFG